MKSFYPSRGQKKNRERAKARGGVIAPEPGTPAGWNPERVWGTPGVELRKLIATAPENVVRYIHAREREHPRYSRDDSTRGRSTVLNRCEERLGELHAPNPNTEEAHHAAD